MLAPSDWIFTTVDIRLTTELNWCRFRTVRVSRVTWLEPSDLGWDPVTARKKRRRSIGYVKRRRRSIGGVSRGDDWTGREWKRDNHRTRVIGRDGPLEGGDCGLLQRVPDEAAVEGGQRLAAGQRPGSQHRDLLGILDNGPRVRARASLCLHNHTIQQHVVRGQGPRLVEAADGDLQKEEPLRSNGRRWLGPGAGPPPP